MTGRWNPWQERKSKCLIQIQIEIQIFIHMQNWGSKILAHSRTQLDGYLFLEENVRLKHQATKLIPDETVGYGGVHLTLEWNIKPSLKT